MKRKRALYYDKVTNVFFEFCELQLGVMDYVNHLFWLPCLFGVFRIHCGNIFVRALHGQIFYAKINHKFMKEV